MFSEDDGWDVVQDIPNDTAAALVLIEHHWAVPLRDAIVRAGGFRISDGFISPLDLVEIGLVAAEEAAELHAHRGGRRALTRASGHALQRGRFPGVLERRLGRPVEAQDDAEVLRPGPAASSIGARARAGGAGCRWAASRRGRASGRAGPRSRYALPSARAVSDQKPWTGGACAGAKRSR